MKIQEMRKLLGDTQQHFSERYRIPLRTLQSWESGERKCPAYVMELLEPTVKEDYEKEIKMGEEKTKNLIEKYHIHLMLEKGEPNGKIMVPTDDAYQAKEEGELDLIIEKKPEIVRYLLEKKEKEDEIDAERESKIDAIEGLKEIGEAREGLVSWQLELKRSLNSTEKTEVRPKPEYDFEAMRQKYPRAVAYLKAQDYAGSSNPGKAAAGDKALERIINGDDYREALKDMEAEWEIACMQSWN